MSLLYKDRVMVYTNTIGTDPYSVTSSIVGYEDFASNFTDGDSTYYCVTDGGDFEIGVGTISNNGLLLSRDRIVKSSNSDNPVAWVAGNKKLFCTYSSERLPVYGASAPTQTTNVDVVGVQYINTDTGEIYTCIDNTTDNVGWVKGLIDEDAFLSTVNASMEATATALVIALA